MQDQFNNKMTLSDQRVFLLDNLTESLLHQFDYFTMTILAVVPKLPACILTRKTPLLARRP